MVWTLTVETMRKLAFYGSVRYPTRNWRWNDKLSDGRSDEREQSWMVVRPVPLSRPIKVSMIVRNIFLRPYIGWPSHLHASTFDLFFGSLCLNHLLFASGFLVREELPTCVGVHPHPRHHCLASQSRFHIINCPLLVNSMIPRSTYPMNRTPHLTGEPLQLILRQYPWSRPILAMLSPPSSSAQFSKSSNPHI